MPDMEKASAIDFEAEAKKLRKCFKFTEDDLIANQSGVLSEKQAKRFAEEESGGKRLGLIIGGSLLAASIAFTPLVFFWFSNQDKMNEFIEIWLLWAVFGVVFALILLGMAGVGIFMIVGQFVGRKKNALTSVRGQARLEKGHTSSTDHHSPAEYYDLYIGEEEFDGEGSWDKAIIRGAEYIVYYMDGINEIMSVELVSG